MEEKKDIRFRYKEKVSSNTSIRGSIEEDAYEEFLKLAQSFGTSINDFLRMKIYSALDYNYIDEYTSQRIYMKNEKMVNKIVVAISKEAREQFQELCKKNNTNQSEVFRRWIYRCLDRRNLLPIEK